MRLLSITCLLLFGFQGFSQNLPSLLSGRDINSTFSIMAYDEEAQEWGIAVATNNLYVGNSTIYIEPGLGAFSVIAETEPFYAKKGFEQLEKGLTIEQAILFTRNIDANSHYRQVAGLDKQGNSFAFTGEALRYWNGRAGHLMGENYVVMGNQLEVGVLENMAQSFEQADGSLAQRLMEGLLAGQVAGGQVSGKQSAALVVKGSENEWFNQVDLRVDHSKQPFEELQTLLNYHYGRIRLNQSIFALEAGNRKRAETKLAQAEEMLEGWNGMYGKIALAHSALGRQDEAVRWVRKALLENPYWKVNLPAFYFLKDHPQMKGLINTKEFSLKDWENAIEMLIRKGKHKEAIDLLHSILTTDQDSSYLNYLMAKAYVQNGEESKALANLRYSLQLDKENIEARLLLEKLEK